MKASSASVKRAPSSAARSTERPAQPFTGLRFAVGIEGLQGTRAVEVVLPAARIVEVPRRRRDVLIEPLLLRRGLTDATDWYEWWNDARRLARAPRRLVSVTVMRLDGSEGVRWLFRDAVPVGYALSPLNALVGATVIESLELRVGDFELVRRE
ncbi:MAG: phage tail protein [Burkholderiaceae bacterium]